MNFFFSNLLNLFLEIVNYFYRVFAVLKGAADGGIWVPHSNRRFPGFKEGGEDDDKSKYNPKIHRDRIFGAHIDHIMKGV